MLTKDYILNTLREHKIELSKLGVSALGLFGSYRRNEQSVNSDIDLLIDFDPEQENFDNYMAAYDVLKIYSKMRELKSLQRKDSASSLAQKF